MPASDLARSRRGGYCLGRMRGARIAQPLGLNRHMASAHHNFGLWLLFPLQALCAAFFLADGVFDLLGVENAPGVRDSDGFEYLVVIVLVVSLAFTGRQLFMMMSRHKRIEDQLRAASGAFAELVEEHFERWALTPSERDVAFLAIKGLSIAEIARLRETKEGTIKTQCNAIYRKAGVTGRPQLISLFVEELMGEGLTPPRPDQPAKAITAN